MYWVKVWAAQDFWGIAVSQVGLGTFTDSLPLNFSAMSTHTLLPSSTFFLIMSSAIFISWAYLCG